MRCFSSPIAPAVATLSTATATATATATGSKTPTISRFLLPCQKNIPRNRSDRCVTIANCWLTVSFRRLHSFVARNFYSSLCSFGGAYVGTATSGFGKHRLRSESQSQRTKSSTIKPRRTSPENATTTTTTTTTSTVEAVFVFHRHGDRTPGVSLVDDRFRKDEASFWKTKLPPASYHEAFSERFPVIFPIGDSDSDSDAEHVFDDTADGNDAYGYLTWKGMDQMYRMGRSMAQRYGAASANNKDEDNDNDNGRESFRECWDIGAVSTNYLRTVMSCQAFLDGLLSSPNRDLVRSEHDHRKDAPPKTHYESISPHNLREAPPGFRSIRDAVGAAEAEILVRDSHQETLNAFGSSPELMKRLMGKVVASPGFLAKDEAIRPLKEELLEYLPGLAKESSYMTTNDNNNNNIKINWIHAADHFVCRSSHGVPPQLFCPDHQPAKGGGGDEGGDAERRFAALGTATLSHLGSRFRSYYSNPTLLGEMAGPALSEVCAAMNEVALVKAETPGCDGDASEAMTKKAFRIYSCHDVTILALLYAMGGTSAADNFKNDTKGYYWPTYGSCLTLELIKVAETKHDTASSGRTASDNEGIVAAETEASFFVRAHLSEPPIPPETVSPGVPFGIVAAKRDEARSNAQGIDLAEFRNLVEGLNSERDTES